MYASTKDGVEWMFSKTTRGYWESIELTDEEYEELTEGEKQGKIIMFTHGEKPHLHDPIDEETQIKINNATQYLYATDYVVVKIAEGASKKEDYEGVLQARANARKFLSEI